jgi:hypothetical protein
MRTTPEDEFRTLTYQPLIEEFLCSDDSYKILNIINVFTQSEGDKTAPLQAMVLFVKIHGRDKPPANGIKAVIRGIGLIGGENEKLFLQDYLDLEDTLSRHVVKDSIKLITKRLEATKREDTKRDRHDAAANATQKANNSAMRDEHESGSIFGSNKSGLLPIVLSVLIVVLILVRLLYVKRST